MAVERIEDLEVGIKREIEHRIRKMAEQEIERAKQEIEKRVRGELAALVLGLSRHYEVTRFGETITIVVHNKGALIQEGKK